MSGRTRGRNPVSHRAVAAVLAMVVSLLVLLTMPPSAEAAPGLVVDPQSGSPGDSVTASVMGFDECVPPVPADVQQAAVEVEPAPASVTFAWDDGHLSSESVTGGVARARFLVPVGATLREHSISATCDQNPDLRVTRSFAVVPPEPALVAVPGLGGKSLGTARALLEDARLVSGTVTGSGDVVRRQDPVAGTEVAVGTPVDVDLGTPAPVLVTVPKVTGLTVSEAALRLARKGLTLGSTSSHGDTVVAQSPVAFARAERGSAVDIRLGPVVSALVRVPGLIGSQVAEAPRVLSAQGLLLGPVTGRGDTVRSQRPRPGTLVPRGTSVALGVEPGVRPSRLVPVPDVAGMDVRVAEEALVHAGLRSGGATTGGRGTVLDTEPAAGVLVPRLTVVTLSVTGTTGSSTTPHPTDGASSSVTPTPSPTVRLTPTPSPTPAVDLNLRRHQASFPLVLLVVVGLAALLGGAATARHVRGPRSRAGALPEVRAVPAGMLLDLPRIQRQGEPPDEDVSISIQPHPDSGTHVIEETRP